MPLSQWSHNNTNESHVFILKSVKETKQASRDPPSCTPGTTLCYVFKSY